MKTKFFFRLVAVACLACTGFALMAGCKSDPSGSGGATGAVAIDTGVSGNEYFYMDRGYALDATQVAATEAEFKKAEEYLTQNILESVNSGKIAFDFAVDGAYFSEVFTEYEKTLETTADDKVKTDYTLTYKKDGEPIQVIVYASLYKVAPVVEWTIWLENTGTQNSGIITQFSGLKETFADADDNLYKVLRFSGGRDANVSFLPEMLDMEKGKEIVVSGTKGRPSVRWAPYLNFQWNNSEADWGREGVFISIGWGGQWIGEVTQDDAGLQFDTRQEHLNTYLEPGEKIRSALITMLFWERDLMRSQNIWREFVYNYVMFQPDGEPLPVMQQMNTNVYATNLMEDATTENQLNGIQVRLDAGFEFQQWQMDAGWNTLVNGGWWYTGNWQPDPDRFPNGFASISDLCHEHGIDTVLWYEPERVTPGTEFRQIGVENGWLLSETGQMHDFNLCWNLADEDAFNFLCEYIVASLKEHKIDVYRQDCNFEMLEHWRYNDAEDRMGITENKYIVNYYAYYDYILENVEGIYIDSCASGGKRIDLETQRRSFTLWRDDKCNDPITTQCQTWGINFFNPYSGQSTIDYNFTTMKYSNRSNYMQCTNFVYNIEGGDERLIEKVQAAMEEHATYSPYFVCDYYPLSPFSEDSKDWMAYQWHDRNDDSGIFQVFKRSGSNIREETYYLNGLYLETVYAVTDIDTGETVEKTGLELMRDGFTVEISAMQDAKIFHYVVK